jgi:Tfp pilus assembly pilus retraction ATPase PilT
MAVDVAQLLSFTVKNNASDLHLSGGVPPMIRVDGDIKRINMPALTHKDVNSLLRDSQACAFPRQRLQPEPRLGCSLSHHPVGNPDSGRSRRAVDFQGRFDAPQGNRAGNGTDRLG